MMTTHTGHTMATTCSSSSSSLSSVSSPIKCNLAANREQRANAGSKLSQLLEAERDLSPSRDSNGRIAAVLDIRSEDNRPGDLSDNEDDGVAAAQDEGAVDVHEATWPTATHSVWTEDSLIELEDGYLKSQGPENPSPQPEDGYPNTQGTGTSSVTVVTVLFLWCLCGGG